MQLKSTALVLLDFQPHATRQHTNSHRLISNAVSLLSACRKQGVVVAHVRVAFEEQDYHQISPQNKGFSYLKGKESAMMAGLHASLPHMDFHPEIRPNTAEIVVRKTRVGAFTTTNLHAQLQSKSINHLIIAGISTSGAVLSTVRDASDKDYAMTLVSDACADKTESVHEFLLNNVFPKTCDILNTEEAVSLILASPLSTD